MFSRLLFTLCVASFALAEPWHGRAEPSLTSLKNRANFRESRDKMMFEQTRKLAEIHRASRPKTASQQATNPDDKAALEAFYRSTNGEKWSNNSGWMKGDPCQDRWLGLYCIDGRVLEIDLVYNLMTGYIPTDITKATKLKVLRLYSNDIKGTLPAGLFEMKSLQILDVNYNEIGGQLPDRISCPNLTQLILYNNKFQGAIPSAWDTPKLQMLSLSSNQFQGPLPPAIGRLTNLTQLVVSFNQLTGSFPDEYGQLTKLEQLWTFQNTFTDSTIPKGWSGMKSLSDFEADLLRGELPMWIGDSWSNMQVLIVSNGYLTGQFWPSLCNMRKIQHLRLFNNSLEGTLPRCICQLTPLLDLELSDNSFTGPIPDCIGNLRNVQYLYFSRNNITGTLPVSMGEMVEAQIIDVSSNGITGTVPSSFASLTKETVGFSLCYNKLSTIESGLDAFFQHIKDYSCALYSNPWSCPLPPEVPKECDAVCSKCNTGNKHTECPACVHDPDCGFCNQGPNCLEGSRTGPDTMYWCKPEDWKFLNNTCS